MTRPPSARTRSSVTTAGVAELVNQFVRSSDDNDLHLTSPEPAFGVPLVGFARADDVLWEAFKDAVGPFHWTPLEAFARAFPGVVARAEELLVVSWVLPKSPAVRRDNRRQTTHPSERWARARVFGEEFNNALRAYMVRTLMEAGLRAVAPVLLSAWSQVDVGTHGLASMWSERHVAYATGLGTFGLCDGLITPLGKAVRLGSVVVTADSRVPTRPYKDHHAYCPFFIDGSCASCISRCPAGAITRSGHDKARCERYLDTVCRAHIRRRYCFDGYGCGLCQTRVPCERGIPGRARPAT